MLPRAARAGLLRSAGPPQCVRNGYMVPRPLFVRQAQHRLSPQGWPGRPSCTAETGMVFAEDAHVELNESPASAQVSVARLGFVACLRTKRLCQKPEFRAFGPWLRACTHEYLTIRTTRLVRLVLVPVSDLLILISEKKNDTQFAHRFSLARSDERICWTTVRQSQRTTSWCAQSVC